MKHGYLIDMDGVLYRGPKANASLFPKNRTSGRFAGNGLCRAYSCKFAQWANV